MTKAEIAKAQLVILTGLLAFYCILTFRFDKDVSVLIPITLGLGLVFWLIPPAGNGIVWLWFKLGEGLGWVNSRVILTLVFFLIVLPMGIIHRLRTKNAMSIKPVQSTFDVRDHSYTAEDLENTW